MSNTAMESTSCHVEKSTESYQASAASASEAYCKDAPTDLGKGSNTADQHLNQAKISDTSIDFGPPGSGKKQDVIDHEKKPGDASGATPEGSKKTGESVTNLDGSGWSREYGADDSRKETSWDKNGNRSSETYDKSGRKTEAETYEKGRGTSKYRFDEDNTKHYSHRNDKGELVEESMIKEDGSRQTREYQNEKLRKSTSRDKDGNENSQTYDDKGRLTELREGKRGTSKYRYDEDNTQHYSHRNEKGELVEESMLKEDGSRQTREYQDEKLRKSTSRDKDGNENSQTYDDKGRLTELREGKRGTSKYRYDEDNTQHYSHRNEKGELVEESMIKGDGSGGEAREYYPGERLRQSTSWNNGIRNTESYDKDGNLTEAEARGSNNETFRHQYDNKGSTYFSHKDQYGKVIEESLSNPDGSGQERHYDGDKLRSSKTWGKDKSRAYDPNFRRGAATPART